MASDDQLTEDGYHEHQNESVVTNNLSISRNRYAKELEDPNVRARLFNSIKAEVGGQDDATKLKYLESVFNRAAARGMTINDVISSDHRKGGYYPPETIDALTNPNPPDYSAVLSKAMNGSNTSNFATGNESGGERSGGAPIVSLGNKEERFVVETADTAWAKSLGADLKPISSKLASTKGTSQDASVQQASTVKPYVPGSEKTSSTTKETEEATPVATIEEPDHPRYTVEQPKEELASSGSASSGAPEAQDLGTEKVSQPSTTAKKTTTEEEQPNALADILNQIWEQHA